MVQAGRDLTFISLSMSGCFSLGALLLLVEIYFLVYWRPFRKIKSLWFSFYALTILSYLSCFQLVKGYGLPGCWFALVGFQWVRLSSQTPTCKNLWFVLICIIKFSFRVDFSLLSSAFFLLVVYCSPKIWSTINRRSSKLLRFQSIFWYMIQGNL